MPSVVCRRDQAGLLPVSEKHCGLRPRAEARESEPWFESRLEHLLVQVPLQRSCQIFSPPLVSDRKNWSL